MSWVFIFSGDVQGLTDCGCFSARVLKGVSGHLTSPRTFVITPLGSPAYAAYTLYVDLPWVPVMAHIRPSKGGG